MRGVSAIERGGAGAVGTRGALQRVRSKPLGKPSDGGRTTSRMNASSNRDSDVLIVGAGPTGLVLALWLTRLGVRVRIVDKTAEAGTTSRALAVQARTLEFYSQIGIAEAVIERGRKVIAANFWVAGNKKARVVFGDIGEGLSPFPFPLVFPQDEHERLLVERLGEGGVQVE